MPLSAASLLLRRTATTLVLAGALVTGAALAAEPQAAPKAEPQAAPRAEPQAAPKAEPQAAPRAEPQAPAAAKSDKPAAKKMEFEKYVLVILRRGPAWTPERTPASDKLQTEHLGHLRAMAEAGKMVVAGPFGDQEDQTARGLCLYRGVTLEEARKLAEQDPAVKAGRLKVEAMTWYTEKGAMTFPLAEELAAGKR